MEIILLEYIENLGDKHDIVQVKDGYGRNYLIPQKMAIIANATNRKRLNELRRQEAAREEKMLSVYQDVVDKLEGQIVRIGAKSGTTGKIFGSVTPVQIAHALKEQFGVDVERRKIEIPEEVKTLGTYTALLHLHPKVEGQVAFEVMKE